MSPQISQPTTTDVETQVEEQATEVKTETKAKAEPKVAKVKKAPAKPAAKKPVAKKPVAKAPAKKAAPKAKAAKPVAKKPAKAKTEKAPRDKSVLSKPQIRILQCLAKGKALSRKQISEKAPVDNALCTSYIGAIDPEILARPEHAFSLINRKFVRAEQHDVDGKDVILYTITASGKVALSKAIN
jgi:hypothetical protein